MKIAAVAALLLAGAAAADVPNTDVGHLVTAVWSDHNPERGAVTPRFSVAGGADVGSVLLVDVRGRIVSSYAIDRPFTSGVYSLQVDLASGVRSGVYWLVLTSAPPAARVSGGGASPEILARSRVVVRR